MLRLSLRHRRPDETVRTGPLGPPNGRKGNRLTLVQLRFLKRLLLEKGQRGSISRADCNQSLFMPLSFKFDEI